MSTWDDKPNDYGHALAIIERLRAELAAERERCAKVAEAYMSDHDPQLGGWVAAAIRGRAMTDIVEQLHYVVRTGSGVQWRVLQVYGEAAAEIKRLRTENKQLRAQKCRGTCE